MAFRSGSAKEDTLGSATTNTVYNMAFTFPHTDISLSQGFASSGLDAVGENWGLDNVKVEIID